MQREDGWVGGRAQVAALDEQGSLTKRGSKVVQSAQGASVDPMGPPTTLSVTGRDRLAFAQASLTRDATYHLAGATLGPRDILQVPPPPPPPLEHPAAPAPRPLSPEAGSMPCSASSASPCWEGSPCAGCCTIKVLLGFPWDSPRVLLGFT